MPRPGWPASHAARRRGGRGRSRCPARSPRRARAAPRRRRRPGPSQRASGSGSTRPSARRSAALVRRTAAGGVLRRGRQQAAVEQVGAQQPRLVGHRVQRARREGDVARRGSGGDGNGLGAHAARTSGSISDRAAAKRPSGASAATARASSIVSMSRSGGRIARPQAEDRQPRALDGAGVVLAHRDAVEHPRVGLAQADAPVAAVERGAERRVAARERVEPGLQQRGRDLRRVHADQEGGPARRRRTPPRAARRGRRRAAARPRSRPGSTGRARRRARATRRTSRSTASAAASVSSIAGGASRAACSGVQGGVSRVFTRPGTGALAMTRRAGGHGVYARRARIRFTRGRAAMSRTAADGAAHGPGDLRAALAGEVAHRDLLEPPARGRRAQDHLQRPAEAAVADAEREQRLAARGAHRPEVGQRARRCGGAARTRAPRWRPGRAAARPCSGPARRAPSTRSAVPAATGSTTRESSRGSNDASQSMKQTMSAVGGAQAGEAGGAEARLRLVHDARAERARRARPSRRSSRCRRRSAS